MDWCANMATRDWTERFKYLRSSLSDSKILGPPGSAREMKAKLFDEEQGTGGDALPPLFMELMSSAKEYIKLIQSRSM